MIGGFIIPLLIIIISYSLILSKLYRRGSRFANEKIDGDSVSLQSTQYNFFMLRSTHIFQYEIKRSQIMNAYDPDGDKFFSKSTRRIEMRATRTALLVCCVFCLAWGPYSMAAVLSQMGFDNLVNPYVTAMLGLFTKTAACLNPMIYAWSSRTFRSKMRTYYWRRHEREAESSI